MDRYQGLGRNLLARATQIFLVGYEVVSDSRSRLMTPDNVDIAVTWISS